MVVEKDESVVWRRSSILFRSRMVTGAKQSLARVADSKRLLIAVLESRAETVGFV